MFWGGLTFLCWNICDLLMRFGAKTENAKFKGAFISQVRPSVSTTASDSGEWRSKDIPSLKKHNSKQKQRIKSLTSNEV